MLLNDSPMRRQSEATTIEGYRFIRTSMWQLGDVKVSIA